MDFRRRKQILKWAVLLVTICFAVAVAIGLVLHWNGWSCGTSAACVARLGWLPAIRSASEVVTASGAWSDGRGMIALYATLLAVLAPLAGIALVGSVASLAHGLVRRSRALIMIAAGAGVLASFVLAAYGTEVSGLFHMGAFELTNWLRFAASLASIYAGALAGIVGAVVVFLGYRAPARRSVG